MQCKIAPVSCLKGISLHLYSFGLSFCLVRVDGEGKGEEASGSPAAIQEYHMHLHAPGSAPLLARQDVKYLCGTRAYAHVRPYSRTPKRFLGFRLPFIQYNPPPNLFCYILVCAYAVDGGKAAKWARWLQDFRS